MEMYGGVTTGLCSCGKYGTLYHGKCNDCLIKVNTKNQRICEHKEFVYVKDSFSPETFKAKYQCKKCGLVKYFQFIKSEI
jgi:hypothetical protein